MRVVLGRLLSTAESISGTLVRSAMRKFAYSPVKPCKSVNFAYMYVFLDTIHFESLEKRLVKSPQGQ